MNANVQQIRSQMWINCLDARRPKGTRLAFEPHDNAPAASAFSEARTQAVGFLEFSDHERSSVFISGSLLSHA